MAVAGPRAVQPGAVDPHSGRGTGAPLLLSGYGLPRRRSHIRQRASSQHRVADCTHAQVLLLAGQPSTQERHRA